MRLRWVAFGIGMIMLAGCAGNSGTTGLMVGYGGNARETQSFNLRLLDDGSGNACQPGEAWLTSQTATDGTVAVEVHISGAEGLSALYCAVDYEAGSFAPASAAASGLLGERGELLELAVFSEPGTAYLGQVQTGAEGVAAPFAGDGIAARFVFEAGEFTAAKCVSRAPEGEWNEFSILYDSNSSENYWFYTNAGDYNQDSEVGIQDLASLASKFGESTKIPNWETGFTGDDYKAMTVDGDHNGEINQGDIVVIGMNFGVKLDHYSMYTSDDPYAYPMDDTESSAVTLAGEYSISDAVTTSRISVKHFRVDQSFALDDYAWIIPYDTEGNAGKVSLLRPTGNWNGQLYDPDAVSPTWWDGEANTLSWFMALPGDYDQNGETGTGDLEAIAVNYGTQDDFPIDSAYFVVDGNHDGIINNQDSDITMQYFAIWIQNYSVYTSDDISEYPTLPVAASDLEPVAEIATYGTGDPWLRTEQGRRFFSFTFNEGELKQYVWVRPISAGHEGTPGELIDTQADTN